MTRFWIGFLGVIAIAIAAPANAASAYFNCRIGTSSDPKSLPIELRFTQATGGVVVRMPKQSFTEIAKNTVFSTTKIQFSVGDRFNEYRYSFDRSNLTLERMYMKNNKMVTMYNGPCVSAPETPFRPVFAPEPASPRALPALVNGQQRELIFFAYGKTDLDSTAKGMVADLVRRVKGRGFTSITIAGYADSAEAAEGIADRMAKGRAAAIKSELAAKALGKGVALTLSAHGDTNPIVVTPAGAREAQNRRVEIILRR